MRYVLAATLGAVVTFALFFLMQRLIAQADGRPDDLAAARVEPGALAAFLELHIEQGSTLEREGVAIGVVEGIVGIRRWFVTVTGSCLLGTSDILSPRRS